MWEYQAKVLRVVDGDTLDLMIDLGFRVFAKHRVRLHGIDTPETYGVKKESEEYKAGMAAKEFVESWLRNEGGEVLIRSHDGGTPRAGKYGRWLVDVYPLDGDADPESPVAPSLNEDLVAEGHATVYTGGR
jgi:micrococcal nuclease